MSQQRFAGKVVIVTGSSSGIGRDAAIEFAKEGASVVLHGQSEEKLDESEKLTLAEGVPAARILKVIGSLTDEEMPRKIIAQTLDKFGQIDVLVNNAGTVLKPGTKDPLAMHNLDWVFAVNFRSAAQLCLLALPHLEATKGNILNISSVGSHRAFAPFLFYTSLKAALDHWTRGFAQMATPKGVRVNALNPGPIETPIFERNGAKGTLDLKLASATLMGRMGRTEEMSPVIMFLCSDEASYISGATLLADGGWAASCGLDLTIP